MRIIDVAKISYNKVILLTNYLDGYLARFARMTIPDCQYLKLA